MKATTNRIEKINVFFLYDNTIYHTIFYTLNRKYDFAKSFFRFFFKFL